MKRFIILLIALLWLLPTCGGNRKVVSQPDTLKPADTEEQLVLDVEDESEEALVGVLSNERLEKLYSQSSVPGLDESFEQEMKKWELQKTFDMPIQVNKQVRNYIYYFSTDRKEIFSRYLSRSTRYLPMIKKIFAEYGLPEDLAYLAMIESGYSNRARSHANAVGMWQFIRGTAVRYGLTVDNTIDERRDPEKATRAAAEYLLDLYKRFGSWYLAAASYNCGEGRVQREINNNYDLKNFWDLSNNFRLPTETKNYVPQMIAATIIAKSPEKYGFKNIPYQPPLKYDLVKVDEATSFQAAAVATGSSVEIISALNPELLRNATPAGYSAYLLKVPPGKKQTFEANITMARAQFPASGTMYAAGPGSGTVAYASSRSSRASRDVVRASVTGSSRTAAVGRTKSAGRTQSVARGGSTGRTVATARSRTSGKPTNMVAQKSTPAPTRTAAVNTAPRTGNNRQVVVVAATVPSRPVASNPPSRSARDTARANTRETPSRSAKLEAPMTASMLPGLGTAKKSKEAPSIARKPSENANTKKKKNDKS
ncbi:MAG: hypothetical protein FJ135_01470 [Deltaproteobacteria bacterium]|nr:hypothetical protein [Deltaproteobacteria bacterium]